MTFSKLLRVALLLTITVLSGRLGRWTTTTLYEVLDVQITIYSYILEGREQVATVTDQLANGRKEIQSLFGKEQEALLPSADAGEKAERLNRFAKNLRRLCVGFGILIGVLGRKIAFDILFFARHLRQRIMNFVN